MIQGRAKFDGIAVGEGTFSFLGTTLKFEGKAAFVNSRTGDTHGWTTNTQWSPAVIEKLKELRAAMELDLGRLHLADGGEVLVGTGSSVARDSGGGLGEHLGNTPQV